MVGSIRIDDLSDRAFRVLAGALMWCNGQGTDGEIPARYTKYLHPDGDDAEAFDELARAGIWRRSDAGFILSGWSDELRQSTAAEVQRYRESSRRRQQEYRDRQRALAAHSRGVPVTRNATGNVTSDVGSGPSGESNSKRASVTRAVTRNADSPFCAKHPSGTLDPCGACARARVALEARKNVLPGLGWDCSVDGHKLVVDGSCAVCDIRPQRGVA